MESIRAFTLVNNLKDITYEIAYFPEDIIDNDNGDVTIQKEGFTIYLKTELNSDELDQYLQNTPLLKDLELTYLENEDEYVQFFRKKEKVLDKPPVKIPVFDNINIGETEPEKEIQATHHQNLISVNIEKLDKLMNLVGELVISEAMIVENPDIKGFMSDNFRKSARHLRQAVSLWIRRSISVHTGYCCCL
jgi:two-component system chemotaxis sensor kinase CheA